MIIKKYFKYLLLSTFITFGLINDVNASQYYRKYYPVKKYQKDIPISKISPIPSPTPDPIIEEQKIIKEKVDNLNSDVSQSKSNILASTEEINKLKARQNEVLETNKILSEKNDSFYKLILFLISLVFLLSAIFVMIFLKLRKNHQKSLIDIRNQQIKDTEKLISEKIDDFDNALSDNYKTLNKNNLTKSSHSISDFEKNISELINKYVNDYSAKIDTENNKPEALEVKRYLNSILNKEKEISGQIERLHISNTYFNTANALMKSGFYDDAVEEYEESIKANPKFYGAYLNLGKAYEKVSEKNKSIDTYLKAVELNPNYYKAYYNLAQIYFNNKEYDKSIENYEKVLHLKDDNYKAYNNLAIIYNFKGDKDRAKEYYKKAIEINNDYVEAYFNLTVLEYELENKEQKDKKQENNIFHISAIYTRKYNAKIETIEKVDKLLENRTNKKISMRK